MNAKTECFESLSMNGILSNNANLFPFVLSLSKDPDKVFQQPVTADNLFVLHHSNTPVLQFLSPEVSHER